MIENDENMNVTSNTNNNIQTILNSFQAVNVKYTSLQSMEKLLTNLIEDNLNCEFNTEEEMPTNEGHNQQFDEAAQGLIHEIIQYRQELQRKDQLKEAASLTPEDLEVEDEEEDAEELANLQAELTQIELQLAQCEQESNLLDQQINEQNEVYQSAFLELQSLQEAQPSSSSSSSASSRTPSKLKRSSNVPQSVKKTPRTAIKQFSNNISNTEIESLETEEQKLSALLEGLEALYQIKVLEVKYFTYDFNVQSGPIENPADDDTTGLSITLAIKQHVYTFLLDPSNKLYDIQMSPSSTNHNSIDIVKVLFECVQFAPPYDLKYAVFVILSSFTSAALLEEHIRAIQKKYLINYVKETKRIHVTLKSGITAVLRVHDCYPYVPNGVHLESLHVSGEWSKEELLNAKKLVNGMCPTQLQDTIDKLLEVLGD